MSSLSITTSVFNECEQDVVPQGQTLKDSGVEGDNGRVEDSPNQRRHGGVELESPKRMLMWA